MRQSKEVIDFTSSLYLGFRHPPAQIGLWESLSNGKPAALFESPLARQVSNELARLQGLEAGVIGKSTHQLFWDTLRIMSRKKSRIYRDAELYPVAEAGLNVAVLAGRTVIRFPTGGVRELYRLLRKHEAASYPPLILTEGWLPYRGQAAPLKQYLELAEYYKGYLIVDDTQALGIWGQRPDRYQPLGYGGGGIIPYLDIPPSEHLISICSMAKGFGVPVSTMCGSESWIRYFKRESASRLHHSPPSEAEVWAIYNALKLNRDCGTSIRKSLLGKIQYFRKEMGQMRIRLSGGNFPLQVVRNISAERAVQWYRRLKDFGILALLLSGTGRQAEPQLAFIIRQGLEKKDLQRTAQVIKLLQSKNYEQWII